MAIGFTVLGVLLMSATVALFLVFGTLRRWEDELPPIASADVLWQVRRVPGMIFLDRAGQVIARRGPRYGREVHVAQLPLHVRRAFLAAEDVRYYQHGAVDPRGIARALWANLRAGRTVQGASTLTQQLARTLFLSHDETLRRKVQEMMLARRLEEMLGKDGVLDLYLNRTFFGDNAYGLEAASQIYFGKPAAQLTLAESALLAAVPNAPSRLALTNDMDGALARSHRILAIMLQEGWITRAQYDQAAAETPVLYHPQEIAEGEFAYVIDLAARQAGDLSQGGSDLIVTLTVDSDLQRSGGEILRHAIEGEGRRRNATQAALVALAPDGAIRAMVGGVNYETSVFNRVVQARRQPGSAFKPIVFAAALERGVRPSDLRDDAPIRIGGWSPQNYGGHFSGRVTIQQALARSINTVAVRLGLEVGASSLADFARRMGLNDIPANAGPSIALGAYEVSPLSLAGAYQVFQSGGSRTTPYLVAQITDTRGTILYTAAPGAGLPVYDRVHASQMVRMMETVITSGTGRRAGIGRPAAGKTGTSQNWRDAWFVGFTPDWLCAVWVGNDNGRSMAHVTGGEIPAQIWRAFMLRAHDDLPVRDFSWLLPEPPSEPRYEPDPQDLAAEDAPYSDDISTPNPYRARPSPDLEQEPLPTFDDPPLRRPNHRDLPPPIFDDPPVDEPRDLARPPRRFEDDLPQPDPDSFDAPREIRRGRGPPPPPQDGQEIRRGRAPDPPPSEIESPDKDSAEDAGRNGDVYGTPRLRRNRF